VGASAEEEEQEVAVEIWEGEGLWWNCYPASPREKSMNEEEEEG
jgi:hypothetical protein